MRWSERSLRKREITAEAAQQLRKADRAKSTDDALGGLTTQLQQAATAIQTAARGRRVRTEFRPYSEYDVHYKHVCDLIDQAAWSDLLEGDQLRHAIARGEAFAGFREGNATFPPTFKVSRKVGTTYKAKRIPSYCDRILWRSMPPRRHAVRIIELKSFQSVSTSDHKPVVAAFEIKNSDRILRVQARTPGLFKQGRVNSVYRNPSAAAAFPLVWLRDVQLSGFRRVLNDPFCIFYTNPPGLLGTAAPITGIGALSGATSQHPRRTGASAPHVPESPKFNKESPRSKKETPTLSTAELTDVSSPPPVRTRHRSVPHVIDLAAAFVRLPAVGSGAGGSFYNTCSWDDAKLPLLRPEVQEYADLASATLIIAIFDHDSIQKDDPVGTVLVPLFPPEAKGMVENDQFQINVRQRVMRNNVVKGTGYLTCSIGVYWGSALQPALAEAQMCEAGSKASTLNDRKRWMFRVMLAPTKLRLRSIAK